MAGPSFKNLQFPFICAINRTWCAGMEVEERDNEVCVLRVDLRLEVSIGAVERGENSPTGVTIRAQYVKYSASVGSCSMYRLPFADLTKFLSPFPIISFMAMLSANLVRMPRVDLQGTGVSPPWERGLDIISFESTSDKGLFDRPTTSPSAT